MADQRALAAVRRIERALARVEAAGVNPAPRSDETEAHYQRLREAHDTLRHRVGGAIGQLDRLLQSGKAG